MKHLFQLLIVIIAMGASKTPNNSVHGKPFVIGKLGGQMGNNMFQIAATCAHAWDHGAEPYFPDLTKRQDFDIPFNKEHVFFRVKAYAPKEKVKYRWKNMQNFTFQRVPYIPNMVLDEATFQNEKYFAHHREKILELFAPSDEVMEIIKTKYSHILNHPNTVAVQGRWFGIKHDVLWAPNLAQYGYDYFNQAMALFPEESLFVVSSNNADFIKHNIPTWPKNIIILDDSPHIEFFILSLCKDQIISNSTFGWWAAWLNRNPQKIVVHPELWVDPIVKLAVDVYPDSWISIGAKWGKPWDSIDSFK